MQNYRYYILYLTLDGREAPEDAAGDVEYRCISYKSDLVPWLRDCQKRAYDEPGLRESIAQYVRLIGQLTGTDFNEAYMNKLKELCLQDDNLVLVHDLVEALDEAKIVLLEILWREIESRLDEEIPDLADFDCNSDISQERIRRFVTYQTRYNHHGLYLALDEHAKLCVEVEDYIWFGIRCEERLEQEKYSSLVASLVGWETRDGWPLYRYPPTDLNLKATTRDELSLLINEEKRQDYVGEVVSGMSELWSQLKEAGLVRTE